MATAVRGVGRLNSVVENKAGWLDVMSAFVTPPLDETRTGMAVKIALEGQGRIRKTMHSAMPITNSFYLSGFTFQGL